MKNLTKKKKLVVLSFLLFALVFLNITSSIIPTNYNDNSSELINGKENGDLPDGIVNLRTADYSDSYENSGADINITLHQSILNTSTISFSN